MVVLKYELYALFLIVKLLKLPLLHSCKNHCEDRVEGERFQRLYRNAFISYL